VRGPSPPRAKVRSPCYVRPTRVRWRSRPIQRGTTLRVLLRVIAVLCILIAAFLVYAVIHALASEGGARAGVAVGYIVGAIILALVAGRLWRGPARAAGPAA
jgi:hypothetical protein